MSKVRIFCIWAALAIVVAIPIGAAMTSPLLAWRNPVYIIAGLAGVIALCLLLIQPMLAAGYLPGLSATRARLAHRLIGIALLVLIVIHVIGLWITSPPDVVDALLFVSPTPFSLWGVIATWALYITACITVFRRKLRLKHRTWRISHKVLAMVIVVASVVHALLIDGTMELISKSVLCALLIIFTATVLKSSKRRR